MVSAMLACGAPIEEVNAVRKHLSCISGGRLAVAGQHTRMVALVLSDVIGDRLDVIASGPTVGDPSTREDAAAVLRKYGLDRCGAVSAAVEVRLGLRAENASPLSDERVVELLWDVETPKPGHPAFAGVNTQLIGSNRLALEAAAASARKLGYAPVVLTHSLAGEASDVARALVSVAVGVSEGRCDASAGADGLGIDASALAALDVSGTGVMQPMALLAGGETTVTIRNKDGKGGRNQVRALCSVVPWAHVARMRIWLRCCAHSCVHLHTVAVFCDVMCG